MKVKWNGIKKKTIRRGNHFLLSHEKIEIRATKYVNLWELKWGQYVKCKDKKNKSGIGNDIYDYT